MDPFIERLREQYRAQRLNPTCRECKQPLPKHVGRGQPRLTCVACETKRLLKRMTIPARACQRCGANFVPLRNNGRKFCSVKCQKASEPSRQRGR
jgi:hypothetical protein